MAKMIIFKKSPTKILLWIMIWQNWSDVSIQINTKALQGIVRCSTSHTRKRRFMLVPGPPLLYGGFAFYNWDILMSKKTYFLLALWQEQLFPFVKVKRQCWLSAGWPMLSAKLREVISAFIFLHPALWMLLHRQRECVLAASQLKCNFIVVAYSIFIRLGKNLYSCVPLPKNNKTK